MKKFALFAVAAMAFAAAPYALRFGPVSGAIAFLVLGVALAFAASGSFVAFAAAGGAVGAFASAVLAPVSPGAAGAALVGLAFAERSSRVRGNKERLLHIAVAVLGGALAGSLSTAYAASSSSVRVVAAVVAAVLVALPLFVEADDFVAHRLETFASDVSAPANASLAQGAELRRAADSSLLDRATRRQVKNTWSALVRLAEARARLEQTVLVPHRATLETAKEGPAAKAAAVVRRVDDRIAEHVAALTRAYTAATTANAAEASLDDAALRSVESAGETLESLSNAIVDEV
ncbi:MAG: hypothetical protein IPK82_08360 [Polyangiaceae bacterium]|nr:hypothetical protein [Polyangiaceae bacterium]